MSGPAPPLTAAPHPKREGGKNPGMRGGRRAGSVSPSLDFPSLSVKIPPNYRITGEPGLWDWGGGQAQGRQAPAPSPQLWGPGIRAILGSPPEAAGSTHTKGGWLCLPWWALWPALSSRKLAGPSVYCATCTCSVLEWGKWPDSCSRAAFNRLSALGDSYLPAKWTLLAPFLESS